MFLINKSRPQAQEFKPISNKLASIIIYVGNIFLGISDFYALFQPFSERNGCFIERSEVYVKKKFWGVLTPTWQGCSRKSRK